MLAFNSAFSIATFSFLTSSVSPFPILQVIPTLAIVLVLCSPLNDTPAVAIKFSVKWWETPTATACLFLYVPTPAITWFGLSLLYCIGCNAASEALNAPIPWLSSLTSEISLPNLWVALSSCETFTASLGAFPSATFVKVVGIIFPFLSTTLFTDTETFAPLTSTVFPFTVV